MLRTLLIVLLAALASQAAAHPHVWVLVRTEALFDPQGRLTALQHTWTFDPAYSAFAVLGMDENGDGKPDNRKLSEMARTNIASMQEFGYFTTAKINGVKAVFDLPTAYDATYGNDRVTLRFTLPLRSPVRPKTVGLQIDDPSFFVAFTLEPGADAVKLAGATAACALSIKRPEKAPEVGVQLLADEIANALKGELGDGSTITKDYKTSVIIACP